MIFFGSNSILTHTIPSMRVHSPKHTHYDKDNHPLKLALCHTHFSYFTVLNVYSCVHQPLTDLCETLPSCFTVTTECHSWYELSPQRHMDRVFWCWHALRQNTAIFNAMDGMFSGLKGCSHHVLKIGRSLKKF